MTDFNERFNELIAEPHIREQAERLMAPLLVIKGSKGAPTLEQLIRDIVTGIIALEAYPDSEQTANNGGITITRGPMDGYGIHLWATDIFHWHLESYIKAKQRETEERK